VTTARSIAADVRSGRVRAVDVVTAALARADEVQRRTNAFITLDHEGALATARRIDAAVRAGGEVLPLAGVPIAVKDNLCTAGLRTTAASQLLVDFVPPFSATTVGRLVAAGAVVIGKTNMDEFGMGSSSEHSAFGAVRHPLDPERVPGGSSGGSAVAVAAGVVPFALGTDTGGSVRQPAAFCGVAGVKPTYGRLSRHGVIAYASSLDQVGVVARDVGDARLALALMEGPDAFDSTVVDAPPLPAGGAVDVSWEGVRIGVLAELAGEGLEPVVSAAFERACGILERHGARLDRVALPEVDVAVATYYVIAAAEASSNLARFDGTLFGGRVAEPGDDQERSMRRSRASALGREVQRRVLMGTYVLSAGFFEAYYGRALQVRRRLADALAQALEGRDALLLPTAPTVAWRLGERLGDPLKMYLGDVTTCLANLAGAPAVSVPSGASGDALPSGVQLLGRPFDDDRLLRLAEGLGVLLPEG
jgi:aspartyl-tRNA(Asn)/glutamyl-tRNA(Gln) amidotransferase subunit A